MGTLTADHTTRFALDGVERADISIIGGDVAITGALDGPPSLELRVLAGQAPEVLIADGAVTVRYPDRVHGEHRVLLELSLPPAAAASVSTVSAGALVAGLEGDVTVRTVSGDVTLQRLAGGVRANTVSGDLAAVLVERSLDVRSVSGDVLATGGRLDHLCVRTVSGDVVLDLDLLHGATAELVTVSGDVALRLPDGSGFDLDVHTLSGDLDCSFELTSEDRGRRSLRGRAGDGRARLAARTTSGDVLVLRRAA